MLAKCILGETSMQRLCADGCCFWKAIYMTYQRAMPGSRVVIASMQGASCLPLALPSPPHTFTHAYSPSECDAIKPVSTSPLMKSSVARMSLWYPIVVGTPPITVSSRARCGNGNRNG